MGNDGRRVEERYPVVLRRKALRLLVAVLGVLLLVAGSSTYVQADNPDGEPDDETPPVAAVSEGSGAALPQGPIVVDKSGQSNMDSILANVVDAYEADVGPAGQATGQATSQAAALAADEAAALAPVSRGDTVLATAYMTIDANGVAADTAPVVAWLQDNSVEARRVGDGYIEVYVPVNLLRGLSSQPGVSRLRAALPPRPAQSSALVPSDAAKLHEADHWFDAGMIGRGVKVGIVDLGFEGIAALHEQGHLPEILVARCYFENAQGVSVVTDNPEDCDSDEIHGTGVAESVADVAPHATLYISNPQTKGDLQDAVEWMEGQGVQVINHSVGWVPDGPGDGTSPQADSPLRTIDSAVEAGAVWVNSAGNDAGNVWYGDYEAVASGGRTWVNFGTTASPDISNSLNLQQGQDDVLIALMRWEDEWANDSTEAGADCDLDLRVYRPGESDYVTASVESQRGLYFDTPVEALAYGIPSGEYGTYELRIDVYDCDDPPEWIQLTAWTSASLEHSSSAYHVANPEESANAGMLAVGAAPYSNIFSLSSYSSRGPTVDGRIKPEIVGVDCGASLTYGTFCGTSQAAPHVAGLAALAIDRYGGDEDYDSPDEIADYLKDNATQRVPAPDPNNLWGHGFATLPNDLAFDVDHDTDDDGLIEVSSVDQLDAIRYDLNGDGQADNDDDKPLYLWAFRFAKDGMGCNEDETEEADQVCLGYELTADLDFDSDDDGDVDEHDHNRLYYNDGQGWDPIGTFQGVLEGNGHTISNLTIYRDHSDETLSDPSATAVYYGLFEEIGVLAEVRNLVLADPDITAGSRAGVQNSAGLWNFEHAFAGPLAGENQGQITSVAVTDAFVWAIDGFNTAGGLVGRNAATITTSYATGTVWGETAGGLAGETYSNRSQITASYAEADVYGSNSIGGLVGFGVSTTIENSYAKGTLTDQEGDEETPSTVSAGGLVGGAYFLTVTNSYAAGTIEDFDDAGGLIADGASNTVTDSYWDTTTTGQTQSQDSPNTSGLTTSQLQQPTGATGIYATWPAGTWDFGTATQYPALKADHDRDGSPTWQEFGDQRPTPESVDPEAATVALLQGPPLVKKSGQSNMDSILAIVVDAYESAVGPAGQATGQAVVQAADQAAAQAPVNKGETVLVTAYMTVGADGVAADTAPVVAWLQDNSVEARRVGDGYIEVYVPVNLLRGLSSQPGVSQLQAALPPLPAQSPTLVPSDAAELHDADHWFDAGMIGRGVKVGIVDGGFEGIEALQEQGHVPGILLARCYVEDSSLISSKVEDCEYGGVHGTAVAESVADVAPHATLYISNPRTKGDLQDAVEWMEGQGVEVINHSVGWVPDGPGDGTSPRADSPLRTIDSAVEAGAVWVNAAGNEAGNVWYGDLETITGDRFVWLDFGPAGSPDDSNSIDLLQGQDSVLNVILRWDDEWANNSTEAGADCDLDLFVYRPGATRPLRDAVAWSTNYQSGSHRHTPLEVVSYRIPSGEHGTYELKIIVLTCDDPPEWIQLTTWTNATLEHASSSHHVSNPGESANAGMLAVGAAPYSDVFSLSSYSSRGPSVDGRIKPDIVGVDCGASLTYGDDNPFCGTSQASPHVAGLAALAIDRYGGDEDYDSPEEIADYLKDNATQRVATPDPNSLWGHGFATLPNDLAFDVDHDTDDDGLIEVSSVDQLDAIRYDLDGDGQADNDDDEPLYLWAFRFPKDGMGCNEDETDEADQVCLGYELTADLDFDSDDNGIVNQDDHNRLYWNDGQGWDPIGTFQGILEGNGHTIANLTIYRDHRDETLSDPSATAAYYGLFEEIGVLAEVRNLVLDDANITAGSRAGVQNSAGLWNFEHAFVGTLAGENQGQVTSVAVTDALVWAINDFNTAGGLVGRNAATITSSYATGTVWGESAGGLAGETYSNRSHITASYADTIVYGIDNAGGLIGFGVSTTITDSYARGTFANQETVAGVPPTVAAGGLVGTGYFLTVTNSYAAGAIEDFDDAGGLIADGASNTVTDSYWDTTTTGQTQSQDSPNTAGKATAELQAPTSATGIYANWPTGTWDFGTATQYPALKADHDRDGTPTWQEFGDQRPTPESAEPEAAAAVAPQQAPVEVDKSGQSNMDSILRGVLATYESAVGAAAQGSDQATSQTAVQAADQAAAQAPLSKGKAVLATAYMTVDAHGVAADTAPVVAWLQENSVEPRWVGDGFIEVYVPVNLLRGLSNQPGVSQLRAALPPQPAQTSTLVPSDAAKLHEADHWFDAGMVGRGVKVGVIDTGFQGISLLKQYGHLPNILVARCYTEDAQGVSIVTNRVQDCEYRGVHGTGVAETVADVAPHATFYISNPYTQGELQDAARWMEDQGVQVINHSVIWPYDGPGDGTSPRANSPLRTIDSAVDEGIVWVNAAGNNGRNVWYGGYQVMPGNNSPLWINFGTQTNPDDGNEINMQSNSDRTLTALLRWEDEWAANSTQAGSDCDLDLFVFKTGNHVAAAWSDARQNGDSSDVPLEVVSYRIPSGQFGTYELKIRDLNCPDPPEWIQLVTWTNATLERQSSTHHVGNPGESANAGMLAVGAAPTSNINALSSWSSRGPTADDERIKPEIVGVNCGSSVVYGTFCGTSQASPHVAGLAALAIDRYGGDEDYDSPDEIADYLKDEAAQRVATPDPNNLWGHGFAELPDDFTFDVDHDTDDDGLIEISSVHQLDAIRYDLNGDGQADSSDDEPLYLWAFRFPKDGMGCNEDETDVADQVCLGYELTADLDFDSNDDGDVDEDDHQRLYWNDGKGWDPIDGTYQAILEGNGHTIANLSIDRNNTRETLSDPSATATYYGLFEKIGVLAEVRNLVLDDANVTAGSRAGAQNAAGLWNFEHAFVGTLAGENQGHVTSVAVTNTLVRAYGVSDRAGGLVGRNSGTITTSYTTGIAGGETAGGITGETYSNRSHITASYSDTTVYGTISIGGLIGYAVSTTIENSYAKGTLIDPFGLGDDPPTVTAGGLVGTGYFITVTNSYATTAIQNADDAGGLIADGASNTVTDSYWDTTTTGQTQSQDSPVSAGLTTTQLQQPTSATGIYANWPTGTWDFGTATQYPALKADHDRDGTPTWQEFGDQRPTPTPD